MSGAMASSFRTAGVMARICIWPHLKWLWPTPKPSVGFFYTPRQKNLQDHFNRLFFCDYFRLARIMLDTYQGQAAVAGHPTDQE